MSEENKVSENSSSGTEGVNLSTLFGVKSGMTRIFDEEGKHIPVTVVKLIPNFITQVKAQEKDGHNAYQVGYGEKREKLVSRPVKGHLAKGNVSSFVSRFSEIRVEGVEEENLGKQLSYETFEKSAFVDVTGISKGKGFQGVMKRHNFAGGPAAHGSHFHRRAGSIGNRATPGRVFKLKKMPGHMGAKKTTVQNIEVIEVNTEAGYMLLKGSIPGAKNGFVKLVKSIKK